MPIVLPKRVHNNKIVDYAAPTFMHATLRLLLKQVKTSPP